MKLRDNHVLTSIISDDRLEEVHKVPSQADVPPEKPDG